MNFKIDRLVVILFDRNLDRRRIVLPSRGNVEFAGWPAIDSRNRVRRRGDIVRLIAARIEQYPILIRLDFYLRDSVVAGPRGRNSKRNDCAALSQREANASAARAAARRRILRDIPAVEPRHVLRHTASHLGAKLFQIQTHFRLEPIDHVANIERIGARRPFGTVGMRNDHQPRIGPSRVQRKQSGVGDLR